MESIKKIMVPVAFSEHSVDLVQYAATLATALDADLILVNIFHERDVETLQKVASYGYKVDEEQYIRETETERFAEIRSLLKQIDFPEERVTIKFSIGRPARDVSEAEADRYILGYTVANDVSARRWQKHAGGGQWVRGKSFDTFCPLGPCLVTADEPIDPGFLELRTTLNGKVMQNSNTKDMIFSAAGLVAELSQGMTLLPGTVILTGTPSGVGYARKPPVYLQPGDRVTVEIEGIGALTNPVTAQE